MLLGDSIYQSDLATEAIKRRHIQLPFAETLRQIACPEKIANNLGDRKDISGVDLAFILLDKLGPVTASFLGASLRMRFTSRTADTSDNFRIPAVVAFWTGTRAVILFFMKYSTKNSRLAPATDCHSTDRSCPTPGAGYTTNSPATFFG